MQIASRMSTWGKGGDLFKSWYPRWGTADLKLALNGIHNVAIDQPHDNNATTWTDIANGIVFSKGSSSTSSALWDSNALAFDSNKRMLRGDIDLSAIPAFTASICGYFGMSWGVMCQLWRTSSDYIAEWMPSGDYIGATFTFHRDSIYQEFLKYQVQGRPTYSEMTFTCNATGYLKVYVNGVLNTSKDGTATAINRVRSCSIVSIGGDSNSNSPPNGSRMYGLTIYGDVLSDSEIAALYQANFLNYNLA